MKSLILICLLSFTGCLVHTNSADADKAVIDSLKMKIDASYHPGLGEFMSGIQTHHAKLWFAGMKSNWKLADFEVHEIIESLDDIENFNKERKESKMVSMIRPALDSMEVAVNHEDTIDFRKKFTVLTETCNKCHQAVDFGFNVVTIPNALPVTNQDFTPKP
jgi:hypothetical protein